MNSLHSIRINGREGSSPGGFLTANATSQFTTSSCQQSIHQSQHQGINPCPLTKGKLHSCNICCKTFPSRSTLERHYPSHTGERPFLCSYSGCGMSFVTGSNARKHERYKHEPRLYTCSECDKAFPFLSELNKHFRSHTGEQPFTCSHTGCDKSFFRQDRARAHEGRPH